MQKKYLIPGFIAMGVFLTCMGFIFLGRGSALDNSIIIVSLFYGVICFAFLIFQMVAFVRAHYEYDEDVEKVKYDVFHAEGVSYEEDF